MVNVRVQHFDLYSCRRAS